MNATKTAEKRPTKEGRGRPCVYNIHKLAIDEGRDIKVRPGKPLKTIRGKLFSSASHFGVKITTKYKNGVLTFWRAS